MRFPSLFPNEVAQMGRPAFYALSARFSIRNASSMNLLRTRSHCTGGTKVARRSRQATEQRKEEHATFVQAQAENQAATQLVEAAKNKLNKSRSSMPGILFRNEMGTAMGTGD